MLLYIHASNPGADSIKTHWGRATHICVNKLTTIGPDNGHYLNHCCNIVNWTLGNKLQWNFNRNSNIFIQENAIENGVCEMASICLGLNVLICASEWDVPGVLAEQQCVWCFHLHHTNTWQRFPITAVSALLAHLYGEYAIGVVHMNRRIMLRRLYLCCRSFSLINVNE